MRRTRPSQSVWIESRKYKSKTTHRVVWRTADGKRDHANFPNWRMAAQFKDQKRQELAGAPYGLKIDYRETVSQAVERYLKDAETYKAKSTVENFDRPALTAFSRFAGGMLPTAVDERIVTEWKLALLETKHLKGTGYSPQTVRMWLRCLRTFLNYLKVPNNPIKRERLPKVEPVGRVLTEAEFNALVTTMPLEAARAARFAYHTGVRIGELLSLDYKHVRKAQEGVLATVTGKTGERTILLNDEAVKAVGRLKEAGPVFDTTFDKLQWYLQEARRLTKLGRVRWHDFRHTFATRYMEATGDIFGLMAYGGWKSTTSMKVYQHITRGRSLAILALGKTSAPVLPPKNRVLPS
jgi:integrase